MCVFYMVILVFKIYLCKNQSNQWLLLLFSSSLLHVWFLQHIRLILHSSEACQDFPFCFKARVHIWVFSHSGDGKGLLECAVITLQRVKTQGNRNPAFEKVERYFYFNKSDEHFIFLGYEYCLPCKWEFSFSNQRSFQQLWMYEWNKM